MPRVGDVMQLLSGTLGVPNTTIQSAPYNAQQNDWVLDANNPRPITAGGTGATTATQARVNLGAIGAGDLAAAATKNPVLDTDSLVMIDSADANKNKRWLVSDFRASLTTLTNFPLRLVSTDPSANADPRLYLDRQSPTPLDGDVLGQIIFAGQNSSLEAVNYADMFTMIGDRLNNQEDGDLHFRRMVNGAMSAGLTLDSVGATIHQKLSVNGDAAVTGNTTFTGTATFNGGTVLNNTVTINADVLRLSSTDALAGAAPIFYLDRISATPAANDVLGNILFRGRNSASATVNYADVFAKINDATSATMDSSLIFRTMTAGALSNALTLGATNVTVHSTMNTTGAVTVAGRVTFASECVSSTTSAVLAATGAGSIYLRPNGPAAPAGNTVISSSGDMTVSGDISAPGKTITATLVAGATVSSSGTVTAASGFVSPNVSVVLAATGAGTVYLRPNGEGNAAGNTVIASNGNMTVVGAVTAGAFSTTGAISGGSVTSAASITAGATDANGASALTGIILNTAGVVYSKKSGTGANTHVVINNNAGATTVGSISSNASATAYNTSSDENLKDFIGPYDPLAAIDIIRRDPVRDFTWKESGAYAIGWGAQTSYAISPDLATPPPAPTAEESEALDGGVAPKAGEPGYAPWGVDQSKRTPYLWAALTWALDRIDDLHDRIKVLEEGTPA